MTTNALQAKESSLVVVAQQLAAEVPEQLAVKAAIAAADSARGIVVTDEDSDVQVQSLYQTVNDGIKAVKAAQDRILGIPKAMERSVRNVTSPLTAKLEAAKKALGAAHVQYIERRQREAEAAAQRRREEAQRVAVQVQATEDPHAPPVEVSTPRLPTRVVGATGSLGVVRDMKVEAVDLHAIVDFDPTLLRLDETLARDLARRLERDAEGAPHPRGGFVFAGIRYWREARAAGR